MYIAENHNLAVRTDFKYSRTNEGIAILTFGLLAFAAAVVFVFAAAVAPCVTVNGSSDCRQPVEWSTPYQYALGAVVFGWIFATLLTQLRNGQLRVEQLVGLFEFRRGAEWWRVTAGRLFASSLSLASGWLVVQRPHWSEPYSVAPYGLLTVAFGTLLATYVLRRHKADASPVRYRAHASFLIQAVGILATGLLAALSENNGHYGFSLLSAFVNPFSILLVSLAAPTAGNAERRSRYRRAHSA